MHYKSFGLALAITAAVTLTTWASVTDTYEVWAIDQSNSPGRTFGGTLYIWDGHELEDTSMASLSRRESTSVAPLRNTASHARARIRCVRT
jgi:hypothetical protein